jgi:hypothetical protein
MHFSNFLITFIVSMTSPVYNICPPPPNLVIVTIAMKTMVLSLRFSHFIYIYTLCLFHQVDMRKFEQCPCTHFFVFVSRNSATKENVIA